VNRPAKTCWQRFETKRRARAHWRDLTRTGHWRRRPQHALKLLDLLANEGRRVGELLRARRRITSGTVVVSDVVAVSVVVSDVVTVRAGVVRVGVVRVSPLWVLSAAAAAAPPPPPPPQAPSAKHAMATRASTGPTCTSLSRTIRRSVPPTARDPDWMNRRQPEGHRDQA
jgi:hypothetical protein